MSSKEIKAWSKRAATWLGKAENTDVIAIVADGMKLLEDAADLLDNSADLHAMMQVHEASQKIGAQLHTALQSAQAQIEAAN